MSSGYGSTWDSKQERLKEKKKYPHVKDKTVEEYLRRHSVLDGRGNMDGEFVPLSIAYLGAQLVADGALKLDKPSWIR